MHEEVNEEDGDHERREEDGQVRQGTRLRRTARPRNADANTRRRTKHEREIEGAEDAKGGEKRSTPTHRTKRGR